MVWIKWLGAPSTQPVILGLQPVPGLNGIIPTTREV
jgi:hypothetical protein